MSIFLRAPFIIHDSVGSFLTYDVLIHIFIVNKVLYHPQTCSASCNDAKFEHLVMERAVAT